MPKKIYEIVAQNLKLRSSPNTTDDTNVITDLYHGLLVERIGKNVIPDENLLSGVEFFKVKVSHDPTVIGYLPFQRVELITRIPLEYFLLITISSRVAHEILR